MKKRYAVVLLLFLAHGISAQYGQIQNGGFESWSDQLIYDTPTDWISSNLEGFYGTPTVYKSTDAQQGMYSAELKSVQIGNDSLISYVYHGTSGAGGPDGGIPYTDNFEAVSIQLKSNLAPGDTLYMISIRYQFGTEVEFLVMPVAYGTNSIWTPSIIYVGNAVQDELFIGFVLGSPYGTSSPTPGSWALIDNIKLLSGGVETSPLPNFGFETWISETLETPDNWYTLSEFLVAAGINNAIKTTDANAGNYAIEMSTVLLGSDTVSSILSLGAIDLYDPISPFALIPYQASPTTFSGRYKYFAANGDQAGIQFQFYEAGSPIGTHYEPMTSQATYTSFSSPLTITGTPDSIVFIAFSGNNPGSVLKLDDLQFSGGNVGLSEFESMSVNIYPNPARSTVMIKASGKYDYSISDLSGKIIMQEQNITEATQLDISHLSAGAYIVKINNTQHAETHRLIVE